jgi:prepilin-type processing-associated H-X9-DG protein
MAFVYVPMLVQPSETIVFGEKVTTSPHYYMDFMEVTAENVEGNDFTEVEHRRHARGGGGPAAGGSNFAFADGSARYLKYWHSLTPVNRWGVTDAWRNNVPLAP